MSENPLRLLILGAHPDDAEFHAGGLAALYRRRGHQVKMVSVTNGGAGHHERDPQQLVTVRRREAADSAAVIGAVSETWDYPDGALQPTLDVRHRIIREIRKFAPDLVLTHRTCDYHPDHRAVGQAVQDASFMVTVPLVAPDAPSLRQDPVVAYMTDMFTRPCPLRGDVVIDVSEVVDTIVAMLNCHASQVYEWLPYNQGLSDPAPGDAQERIKWLKRWFTERARKRADRFRRELIETYGPERGAAIEYAEAYEISEYASALGPSERRRLFPFTPNYSPKRWQN